jgi:hypothetical protein
MVDLADDLYPDPAVVQSVGQAGATLGVDPVPLSGLTYEWKLDGLVIPGADGPEWTVLLSDMTDSVQALSLKVYFDTPRIRLDTIVETYSWTIRREESSTCCLAPSVGDCDQSGSVDISDISVLIDNQFLTLTPLVCEDEGNINYPGSGYPSTDTVIDIADLTLLIDNQFLTLEPLPACP